MIKRTKILKLLESDLPIEKILAKGWVRTKRESKTFSFLEINDGSSLSNLQIIADCSLANYNEIIKLTTGSAVEIKGSLLESRGKGQKWEVTAKDVKIISIAPETYPLQKKRHTDEYLREIAHLRPRTNKYGALFRIRSELSFAIHKFFRDKGFKYLHSPILTGSDCEGAGDMFRVTTLNLEKIPTKKNHVDYSLDFFGQETSLTVSGQLSAEMLALALGDVYTFGPTFRAENSNTSRHVAEFWMVEPEMAFCNLEENINIAEEFIKFLTMYAIDKCKDDIGLFAKFVNKKLFSVLDSILTVPFIRITYKEAVSILLSTNKQFKFDVKFGNDLQSEHERYLTEHHFKKPVIIYNYPKDIKPFYMRLNDDQTTVAAMDLLVPGIGEIIGGSQREERLDILENRMEQCGLDKKAYWWYLDSRKYGTVPHSGFGLGFERLLMLLTGVSNIRDVIPFPRTPGKIEF